MPTPTGLPKPGEVWRITRKLPPDWSPVITDVEIIERGTGSYWPVRIKHIDTGKVSLWVDAKYDFSRGNFKFLAKDVASYKQSESAPIKSSEEPHQGPIQVRWEDGEIRFLDTVKEAFELGQSHPEIWKISWTEGSHRIRLVRQPGNDLDTWKYEPLQVLPDEEGDNWRTQLREQRIHLKEAGVHPGSGHEHFFSNPDGYCVCGAFRYGSTDGDHIVGEDDVPAQVVYLVKPSK